MRCEICGCPSPRFFADKDGYRFVECPDCGFVFLDPMPGDAEIEALYAGSGEPDTEYSKQASRMRRAIGLLPKFLPLIYNKTVLDVGCGGGFKVAAFGAFAKEAVGIDISEHAIAFAKRRFPKYRFLRCDYRNIGPDFGTFDLVYSSEVMEHVTDLRAFMRMLRHVTRPGSRVYITTPDLGHPRVPKPVTAWSVFGPPHHVRFFNIENITRLFADHGFDLSKWYRNPKPGLKLLFERVRP
ncbi:MAG: class I SAM-dependent methyltransferase [Alphaproteobacteria bacterium]